ncbi:MAG TPA: glycoside hydrolase family 2 TIM barrel-domain containing protein [Tepidisphaeraceae bacterium]|nr:glycoside hydrolase family 2 TIM barrel-domain containing protein [Tepidisphaeraceae bacterium]
MSHRTLLGCAVLLITFTSAYAQETQRQYLSGKGSDDAVPWEFFCTAGAKSGVWTTIPVPSCWDALGFGSLNYRQDQPPFEQGKYKRTFTLPPAWEGQRITLVFDGVLTDTQVWINGRSAGDKHQGGFYRFSYDITPLVKFGAEDANLIEVTVDKHSADESVNRAERQGDYWIFGGIFRPVWLEAKPPHHIDRVAIDAKADGSLAVDVFTGDDGAVPRATRRVAVRLREAGDSVATAWVMKDFLGKEARVETKMTAPKLWTAETPNLYELEVQLMDGMDGKTVLHRITQRFGFRTIEVRTGDGVYVNGRRMILKGSNRHSFHPETGRALSAKISRDDVLLMREMNHNAVRMSHYPPDEHFLDACDELGLYVIDELAGWQKSYSTEVGRRLIGQMIRRDANHPSILFWANGNEGGWNTALDDDFAKWDPQNRAVLHPWELFRGINTRHYRPYDEHVKLCNGPDIYLPTEFLHGMYDGGAGAGLADFWEAILKGKATAGGFIWALVDEAVKRPDTGQMDTAGNQAPDGIVGPYREKEAGFYTIKELWSPIQVRRVGDGYEIENRYDFTNAKDCTFTWQLRAFGDVWGNGKPHEVLEEWKQSVDVAPGDVQAMKMEMPLRAKDADALAVRVDDPAGRELWTWVWPLKIAEPVPPTKSRQLPFAKTLRMAGPGKLTRTEWEATADGFVQLDYAYTCEGDVDFHGICFDLPEESLKSMRWLGAGPHRVWKNRLAGTTLGVWENPINDTITGHQEWVYPEFRGCYAGVRWMRLDTTDGPIVIAPQDPSLFVQVLTPRFPEKPGEDRATTSTRPLLGLSRHARADLPDAGLSILHAIPAIGNKFHRADQTGPQGQQNRATGEYRGRVKFFFGDPPRE